ncbi:MAG: uroporphyrinogen-III C-methyltransferase [Actinomycetota bacterium]
MFVTGERGVRSAHHVPSGPGVGTVYLVGAGPGDPELITCKGLRLLHSCAVVAFDRLVHPALVAEAPTAAERVFVGKTPGRPHLDQEVINRLLIDRALHGKTVVRLKGGDPFVFGRGGEEADALSSFGIPFEIVPGVTSATSVPAYAGIPVTHRGIASSFAVITGHRCKGIREPNWQALGCAVDTLVLLMGVKALEHATSELIQAGRDPAEPAAVIEWGTTERQRTVVGELCSISALARRAEVTPPATAIIGEVVRLRDRLTWFEPASTPVMA